MPRPVRCRKICNRPNFIEFSPKKSGNEEMVELTLDEFEVIRLVDLENQTHEQCAKQMEISRTTVTEIYESARKKIADCLVNGKRLVIVGGNYRFCDGNSSWCYKKNCEKKNENIKQVEKGENIMRIAVTYLDGEIYGHFGHTESFKFYDIEDGKVIKSEVVGTNGSGHGALAEFLASNKVDVLICGGIGGGAINALKEAGISLFGGVTGSADEAVQAYLDQNLKFNPNVKCSHHEHEHGEDAHTCGSHGCGKHDCH